MFPLRDSHRPERPPLVNTALILANVAVFAWMLLGLPDEAAQQEFVQRFGLVPANVLHVLAHPGLLVDAPGPALRDAFLPFLTAMFVHGGVAHVLGNLWFLFVFGDNVEGRLGSARYLAFYLLCGIVASALHILTIPAKVALGPTSFGVLVVARNAALDVPMVGASGAIAGVLGFYAVHFPRSRVATFLPPIFFLELPARVFLGIWFALQFFAARSSALGPSLGTSVAYWAHVGGFVAGLLLGFACPRPVRRVPFA